VKKGPNKKRDGPFTVGRADLLILLKADPGFKELEDIRLLCARYLDEDGMSTPELDDGDDGTEGQIPDILPEELSRDHFKDAEMADRASAWAHDFDAVISYLQVLSVSSRKNKPSHEKVKHAYPPDVPTFGTPAQMISYFKDRWEKLKCRYC